MRTNLVASTPVASTRHFPSSSARVPPLNVVVPASPFHRRIQIDARICDRQVSGESLRGRPDHCAMETKRLSSMVPLVDIVEAEHRESAGGQRMSE